MRTKPHTAARSLGARVFYPHPGHVQYVLNEDVHEPKNPKPDVLPPDAREFYSAVEEASEEIYGDDEFAVPEKTAWKAVRMHYEDQGGQWVPKPAVDIPLPTILPQPGDCIVLGKLIEYGWVTPQGDVFQRKFKGEPPDLLWCPNTMTLYSFPTTKVPEVCQLPSEDMDDARDMFKRWSQRDADCNRLIAVPMVRLNPVGAGDTIVYRSDKWHDKNADPTLADSQEYIHLFGDGVWVWEDNNKQPNAIMFRGGRLDVEERGIIH